ncbi:CYTH-like domain-containing protein [Elsinoe ampelina]|uniref:mRNA-capping enzyme subunit beta n=1 Tax=Elsinoe ampelina TaxID=302913 RepID=A0A6A6GG14_9PEZI|nr:CYTH-like domain-containing protein [Elsinoe ampelina]
MDINALMNKEPTASGDQHQRGPPPVQRQPSVARSASDNYGTPPPPQQFQRPSISGYPAQPPPLDTRASTFSNPGSVSAQYTPIRTPQAQHTQQYPFPPQYPSPVQAHHRGVEKFPSLTPTGRSASHSYGHPQPDQRSPSLFAAPPPPPHSSTHSHTSATPPSANLQSPYGARASPGSGQPQHQIPYGTTVHQSHPNTPLGPPPAQRPLVTTPREIVSPYAPHQRSYSGTSGPKSIASNSPGPGVSSINNILDSPAGYPTNIDHVKRRSTEHLPPAERDRTASVSPKTQDPWSARSSINQGRPDTDPRGSSFDQPPASYPVPPTGSLSRSSTGHFSQGAPSPLSQAHSLPPQRQVSTDHFHRASIVEAQQQPPTFKRPSEDIPHHFPREEQKVSLLQQPVSQPIMSGVPPAREDTVQANTPLKRRAEDLQQPEAKKARTQYKEPPPWARLHPSNPGYENQIQRYPHLKDMKMPDPRSAPRPQQPQSTAPLPIARPAAQPPPTPAQTNGQVVSQPDLADKRKTDVSRLLNMPWELSIIDQELQNPITKSVGIFFYHQLRRPELMASNLGGGNIEIEAKIGTLVDIDTKARLQLPIVTTAVLHEEYSKRLKFESMMNELQNKNLNDHLNVLLRVSRGLAQLQGVRDQNRVPLAYRHRHERDTFVPLSQYGFDKLSPFAQTALKASRRDNPRLRVTYENDPKRDKSIPAPVLAKIVKVRIADLDIHCPTDPFDIRISINIEVDFHNRPDVDQDLLADTPTDMEVEGPNSRRRRDDPDRLKDRISYNHLLYQIDLTQVVTDIPGAPEKKHELEVEVDGNVLQEQLVLLQQNKENAFGEIVDGLMNNVLLLARDR